MEIKLSRVLGSAPKVFVTLTSRCAAAVPTA